MASKVSSPSKQSTRLVPYVWGASWRAFVRVDGVGVARQYCWPKLTVCFPHSREVLWGGFKSLTEIDERLHAAFVELEDEFRDGTIDLIR